MARLLVHVEGETEETFVNEILAPHLRQHGFDRVSARLIGNARQRNRRGGIRGWDAVRKDIIKHLREDVGSLATTMVDYYALPQSGAKAWPGRCEASRLPFAQKALTVQTPEEINDSPQTCPSQRIKTLIPDYEKPLMGVLAVIEIGLPAIRQECALFDQWLARLEAWRETT